MFAGFKLLDEIGYGSPLLFIGCRQQFVGELVGFFALFTRCYNAFRQPLEIFHQREPQRDCDGPKLTNCQWRDLLISADITPKRVVVKTAVAMSNKGVGD